MADSVLVVLDLAGTFVFAISGATLGVRRQLDLFGVLVLSIAAATGGGISRDLLIGAVPPPAITDWRYVGVSILAGLATIYRYPLITRLNHPVQIFDGAGLALFAVSGTLKALTFGLGPVGAVLLGMLTGIGGGIVRDILVTRVPVVLRADLYAIAALAGATVVVIGDRLGLPAAIAAPIGAALCFGLRLGAIRRGWHLPVPHVPDTEPTGS